MKLYKNIFTILLSAMVAKSDIITLQWKGSPNIQKKYVTIPAGKVCKMLSVSPSITIGYVDAAGGETVVYEVMQVASGNTLVVAGPVKLYFAKQYGYGSIITLEVTDQSTPKSGVAFTDN